MDELHLRSDPPQTLLLHSERLALPILKFASHLPSPVIYCLLLYAQTRFPLRGDKQQAQWFVWTCKHAAERWELRAERWALDRAPAWSQPSCPRRLRCPPGMTWRSGSQRKLLSIHTRHCPLGRPPPTPTLHKHTHAALYKNISSYRKRGCTLSITLVVLFQCNVCFSSCFQRALWNESVSWALSGCCHSIFSHYPVGCFESYV